MASFAAVCRATARLSSNPAVGARGLYICAAFTSSSRCLAAQNFTMPALSPTMTEGNIAAWNVKEGDSFSAGDVLLEIETDKATMDVEAQEDGVMFKILSQGGAKGVQVGTRIAVVAEPGDDLSSLEVPAEEKASQPAESASKGGAAASQASNSGSSQSKSSAVNTSGGGSYVHKLPLLPSTGHLAAQKGLSEEDLSKIKPTGPNGRLLKGDVLAFLGTIDAETPATISSRFEKLGHLDLSNIKVAAPKKTEEPAKKEAAPAPKAPVIENLEINVPVSLSKVVEVQNKINETLGVFLPLSTFISRAADVANSDLPPASRQPTADELFDQVLGLDKVKAAKGTRGVYLPQISAITPSSFVSAPSKKSDIIDILTAKPKKQASPPVIPTVPGLSSGANVFSLVVPKAEGERAQVFLERCKAILEEEPGRLVL
ncbi:unnamed protein product [Clonostachys rosea]|uniref:Uncharacterized protein n=1 Tax=Bionectria ochroleuca TaxID=29856 RepID=A0ABY6TNX4_BIOOC|nr:unnamed protein product [Clonostachys rosea]